MGDQAWDDGYYGTSHRGSFHYCGKGYFSPEYQSWSAGVRQRESDAAAAKAAAAPSFAPNYTASPSTSASNYPGGGGAYYNRGVFGGGAFSDGVASGVSVSVRGLLGVIFLMSALYGAYDNIADRATIGASYSTAKGGVYALSSILGDKIRNIDPDAGWVTAVNDIQWGIGLGAAYYVGIGAGFGNAVTWVGKEVLSAAGTALRNYSESRPAGASATVTAINLNLRSEPRVDPNNVLTTMPQGLRVKVVQHAENGWLELADVPGADEQRGRIFHGFASPVGFKEN